MTPSRRPPPPPAHEEHLELFAEPAAPRRSERPSRGAGARRPADVTPPPAASRKRPRVAPPRETLDEPSPEELVPGATARSAVSVSTVTNTVRDVLEGAFTPLWVRGEVSGMKAHRNGHWYFCLRDEETQLRCVVWSRDQRNIPAPPDEGMQVVAFGQLTVYPARGELQFTVRAMRAEGDGLWRKALERTVARLNAEGLLAAERKRPLPRFPRRIAVITSPDGAAVQDVIAVVSRRCPTVEIVVVPTRVQGDGAADELCAALETVARWGEVDTIIVGRGGGGREDLWAFNDERLARTLAACPVPTISAVGHEIDLTICDLVADHRAATPSAAAEAAVPVLADLRAELAVMHGALASAMGRQLDASRNALRRVGRQLSTAAERDAERRRARVQVVAGRLQALSPLAILSRGYALARDADGRTLASVADFSVGQSFGLVLRDGEVNAEVRAVPSPESQTPSP